MRKDTVTLELTDSTGHRLTRWNPWILLVLGIIWLGQAALRADEAWFQFTSLGVGIAAVALALYSLRYPSRPFITFNHSGILARLPRGGITHIPWPDVQYLRFSTYTIVVVRKDRRELTVDLGWVSYHTHRTVKPRMIEIARKEGIDVRTSEWQGSS